MKIILHLTNYKDFYFCWHFVDANKPLELLRRYGYADWIFMSDVKKVRPASYDTQPFFKNFMPTYTKWIKQ